MAREQKPNSSRMPAPPSVERLAENPELARRPVLDLDGQPELSAANEPPPVEVQRPVGVSKRKVKVVANRHGFFHQERKAPGDKFEAFEHDLGSWMDCVDPVEQKRHLERLNKKRQKVNLASQREEELENQEAVE